LYGIRTIRLCGDATIETQGKLSLCYEKNISQDTTCRKVFVIGCAEKILRCFKKDIGNVREIREDAAVNISSLSLSDYL
jgi:hypothetical protein